MKKLLCVCSMFFVLASAAHAATPGQVLQLLTLGNQLVVLEQEIYAQKPLAGILVDPSITGVSAGLFGLADSQVALYTAPAVFGQCADLSGLELDTTLPLYVVLGTDPEAIWATTEIVLSAKPELIYAVMKGQTALLGAVVDGSTAAVTFIGTHPDLLPLAARHILGKTAEAPAAAEDADAVAPAEPEAQPVEPEVQPEAQIEAQIEQAEAPETEAAEAAAPSQAEVAPEAQAQSGGLGGFGILLFIAALIGTVILMDKTVLKS